MQNKWDRVQWLIMEFCHGQGRRKWHPVLFFSTLPIPSPAPYQPPEDLWICDFMPCICWKQWHWCTIAHKLKHKIFTVAIKAFQLLTLIYLLCLLCQFLMLTTLLLLAFPKPLKSHLSFNIDPICYSVWWPSPIT